MPGFDGSYKNQALLIDDQSWDVLIALTGGEIALCYQCGVCTAACPWGMVKQKPLTVRTIIRQAQFGLLAENENLWLCTTCAQCEALCPRGVNITRIMRALRTVAWQRRELLAGLPSLMWSIYWNNNPWEQPPSQRAAWSKNLDIPQFDSQQHDILLYIGCTSSYDQRAQKIAVALAALLGNAGVKYGYLGAEEPCCGEAALTVGHTAYFEELSAQTASFFKQRGVKQIVAISPHCYDVFNNHFPEIFPEFQAFHYTQFLSRLLNEGRLNFTREVKMRVTYQDPCYLGRIAGEYAAPRQVLQSIPGVQLYEMAQSTQDALCCGGGGGRMWMETPPGERFADLRIAQAMQTGADLLATACPFCVTCLEDSLKSQSMPHLRVLDVAEIAAQAI